MAEVKRYTCGKGGAQHCYGCYSMDEDEYGDYVSHSDYASLLTRAAQAEQRLAVATEALEFIDDQADDDWKCDHETLYPALCSWCRIEVTLKALRRTSP